MKGFLKKTLFIIVPLIVIYLIVNLRGWWNGTNDANNYANNFIALGLKEYDSGNYTEAIQNFDQAIALSPNNVKAYIPRGIANGALGDYTSAIEDFDKAIELDPVNDVAYQGRGFANIKLNKTNEWCSDLYKARDFGNNNATAMIAQFCK